MLFFSVYLLYHLKFVICYQNCAVYKSAVLMEEACVPICGQIHRRSHTYVYMGLYFYIQSQMQKYKSFLLHYTTQSACHTFDGLNCRIRIMWDAGCYTDSSIVVGAVGSDGWFAAARSTAGRGMIGMFGVNWDLFEKVTRNFHRNTRCSKIKSDIRRLSYL